MPKSTVSAPAGALPVASQPLMSATFNRSRIMQAAHATAKWRVASVGGSYREWFAKALRTEWKRAKEGKGPSRAECWSADRLLRRR